MCVYIKITPHCRLSIECLEIKKKCRQRNSKYEVKSFKQVRIEKYITPLAGSTLTNRSHIWPVNFFSTLLRLAAVNELSTLLSNVIFQLKFHWIISFLRFGVEMINLERSGQAHFIRASSPDSAPRIASLFDIPSLPLARVPPNVSRLASKMLFGKFDPAMIPILVKSSQALISTWDRKSLICRCSVPNRYN